jgi:hypothetical protein
VGYAGKQKTGGKKATLAIWTTNNESSSSKAPLHAKTHTVINHGFISKRCHVLHPLSASNMTSIRAPPVVKSSYTQVDLVPWDPESPEHVERIVQKRIACGWKHEQVEMWKSWQRDGRLVLQWVVIYSSILCIRP